MQCWSPFHNRMPVIVRREDWDERLSPDALSDESFRRITTPYAAEEMNALAVSSVVNSAKIDDARCCEAWDCESVRQKLVIKRADGGKANAQQALGFWDTPLSRKNEATYRALRRTLNHSLISMNLLRMLMNTASAE